MPRRTVVGEGKKVPLNMRTTRELRDKLDKAAGWSGRSLVQEVEHRVEHSLSQKKNSSSGLSSGKDQAPLLQARFTTVGVLIGAYTGKN